ncbi:TetR/AcrR family transcriptional regulator [Lacticaseibacillus zeae]|uniref:TetR/AcrR family transcriptional regulator n=1 Tax=Lacticaseibacillus zeae TaxID=57037 RepID=UPI0008A2ACB7|nr:TetR/AcrR family transcriptional regulator [Lacticaseibacillus zeae]OFR98497.1 hypothetical protein HMPREF2861_06200 [Lactobacillus sp. HMSC068F07]
MTKDIKDNRKPATKINASSEIKDQILQTVLVVIEQKGPKFTTADIAKKMATSKRTVYKYFPSKIDLIDATIDFVFSQLGTTGASAEHIKNIDQLSRVLKTPLSFNIGLLLHYSFDFKRLYPAQWAKIVRLLTQMENQILKLLYKFAHRPLTYVDKEVLTIMLTKSIEQIFVQSFTADDPNYYQSAMQSMYEIIIYGVA